MRLLFPSLIFTALALLLGTASADAAPQHALTVYGEPAKYPAGFSHFAYTNPRAPKGGSMRRSAIEIGRFDHVLPYIDKGIGVSQLDGYIYSPLAQRSLDEPYTVYGLVAEKMERADDGLWLRFYLNPKARFADGKPITAEDVRYTYNLLMTQGSLRYRTQFADVKDVEVESPRVIRFDFKSNENRTLPLDIATLPVLPEHWWKSRDFAGGGGYEAPLGSGPYKVSKVDNGNSITFTRDADWWGKDLPVSRGLYNFDRFSIEYFGDTDVARQVLRGGAYDYNREFSATGFSIGYDSPALDDGRLQKAHLAKEAPQPAQGFVFNLQKPMFQDRRVRQALAMLWDFEWSNRQMMRDLYIRQQSFFSNSALAARALPDAEELKILEPLRGQVPDEVFSQVFEAPKTDGSGLIRDKQLQALALLEAAGWKPDGDTLVNADGEPLRFTFLNSQNGIERLLLPYKRNLAQIGITLEIRRIDASQYVNRLMARDYDMIVTGYPVTTSPGLELYNYFGSAAANDPGSSNLMVLKNPAVDSLISGLVKATSQPQMLRYAHALDRVLQWNYYWIPNYYPPGTSTVWWNRFGMPAIPASNDEAIESWWEMSRTPLTNEQMAAERVQRGKPGGPH
ncbi:microcin C transport system substrate-binding protein [Pseudomonas chlororaphis]|uniref:extracellular solute-binding protein n=1 Tax=Pseudomonas chlororaphis TaxID=587753 RepID=UPI00087DC68D|nr:extracellular solute-binding protein [Pseudomonas chlororaphis]AZD67931.1 ABC transporter, periplasmic substrate-binding protein yejA [Pseudomonas chlororaphis subsp. aurantiaca]QIT23866.1 ABC transporter substrate-binding protein [Pseudomonas chlororaphis subsp. aurantiaca]WDH01971.1 extracellular solute-binding protein [Pseudomonas chlororaphis]WDH09181.1 extracellular solute-binding protein [Pseudomonas chlororaphis]SDS86097.1 microcin C transport system substrate-binding protein [Pseudo